MLNNSKIITYVINVMILLFLGLASFTFVEAGHVGIIKRFGAVKRVAQPGLVLKVPFIEAVDKMETRIQKEEVRADAASKDLQDVSSVIAINYHLDGVNALSVFQNVGVEYRQRLIDPAIQETFKSVTAKYTAEQLITQREAVKHDALAHLKERLEPQFIVIDDINIVNFAFSKSFNDAIEQKQVAQQNVQKEKQNLERIQVEADQAREQAQGQADAQRTLQEAGNLSQEYLDYLAVNKWNGILPNNVGGAVPFVNVPN